MLTVVAEGVTDDEHQRDLTLSSAGKFVGFWWEVLDIVEIGLVVGGWWLMREHYPSYVHVNSI